MLKTAMFSKQRYHTDSGRGRGDSRGAGSGDSVSAGVRCYSCGRNGHMAKDCSTPGKRVCYLCRKSGHESKGCNNRKREGERRDEMSEKRPKRQETHTEMRSDYRQRGVSNTAARGRAGRRGYSGRGRGGCNRPGASLMVARDDYEEGDEMREGNSANYSGVCDKVKTNFNEQNVIVKFIADWGDRASE